MKKLYIFTFLYILSCYPVYAVETTFTPRLNVRGEYTDNLDRTPDNEIDDYILITSPGFSIGFRGATAGLTLSYNPAYAMYKENDDRDTWRHFATLLADWSLSRKTQFNFYHNLTVSDDPADDEDTSTVTVGTNKYMRNSGTLSLTNQFGRSEYFTLGGNYSVYDNEEELLEDSYRLNPYADLMWRFIDEMYGLSLYIDYTRGGFDIRDDFNSYFGRLRLLRRVSRNMDAFLQYAYMQTEYDGDTENYKVHNPAVGFNYIVGEQTNISLAIGYGIRDREVSEDDEGLIVTGDIVTAWIFRRGSINLAATSGYTQDTFAQDNLGFYVYSGVEVTADYAFTRSLRGDIFGNYRYSQYLDIDPNTKDHVYTAGAGMNYRVTSWMRLRLEYAHRNFTSNVDSREYKENRGTLTVTLEPENPYRTN